MSERENLEVQRCARPDQEPKRVEQRDNDGRHGSSLSESSRNLNRRSADGVSGRHTRQFVLELRHGFVGPCPVSKLAREAIAGRALKPSTRQCLRRQHVAFRGAARGRPLLVRGIRTTRFREST